jgi:hypothetical protein
MAMQETLNRALTYINTLDIILNRLKFCCKVLNRFCTSEAIPSKTWQELKKQNKHFIFTKENICFRFDIGIVDQRGGTIYYIRDDKLINFPGSAQDAGKPDSNNDMTTATADEIYKTGVHLVDFFTSLIGEFNDMSFLNMTENINNMRDSAVADLL